MKRVAVFGVALMASCSVLAQGASSLASTMDVYVFPKEGQDSTAQSQAEVECYEWAASNTGSDPFDLQKQQQTNEQQAAQQKQAAQQTGQGSGARGALRGAAAGALVGEIADNDVGRSAAIGAAIGGVSNRRRGRAQQQQAVAQADQQAASSQAGTEEQMQNFKKAFSVCLEAQDYMVKF